MTTGVKVGGGLIVGGSLLLSVVLIMQNPAGSTERGEETNSVGNATSSTEKQVGAGGEPLPALAIKSLRNRTYEADVLTIEEELKAGTNYNRYIASYQSEGLRINGLLTVPTGEAPPGGYPAVVFVHGFIEPGEYSTINSYPTYQTYPARAGYVTFKPDLRGHADSEGERIDPHTAPGYIIDTMNAITSLKRYEAVDPDRIGYWGHSNGGEIGMRVALISEDVKAASLWAGLVGSYEDIFETYVDEMSYLSQDNALTREYGLPSENPEVWDTMDPYAHLQDVGMPIQIQHGTEDESVPVEISRHLRDVLKRENKAVEYFEYEGDDHNISNNVGTAWQRAITFFDRHL